MNESDEKVRELVRRSMGPTPGGLSRDLWPRMQERLHRPVLHVPWWDWALAAAIMVSLLLFPAAIPAVLYQL
jgi:hypothetical protein